MFAYLSNYAIFKGIFILKNYAIFKGIFIYILRHAYDIIG